MDKRVKFIGRVLDGEKISALCEETFKSRYRLLLSSSQFDVCVGRFDAAYHYDMSMIDNKTGEEIMVMGGSACEHQIKDKFEDFLSSVH